MRGQKGRLTQEAMAQALTRELGRHIPSSSVGRWEAGTKLPGADIYRAYVVVTGASLPTDLGGQDVRAMPSVRVASMEQRIARMERLQGLPPPTDEPLPDDLVSTDEAAQATGRSRQTIHNWINAGTIRAYSMGRKKRVSYSDALAEAARLDRLQNRS